MSTAVDPVARASSLRRLHGLVRSVNRELDLDRTLRAVCDGIVEGLGFGVAVVNLVMPDGALEVVAVAGDDGAAAALLGQRASREVWDASLAACEEVGDLLVDYDGAGDDDGVPTWVPDLPEPSVDGAWRAQDALLAPLRTRSSGLLGVISVDLPVDGMRPGAEQLELLEMFAGQASVAVENAALHSALIVRDAVRRRALARLSAVVASAPVGIVELDLDGRVQLWNDAATRIFGWEEAEVLGERNPVAPQDEQYEAALAGLREEAVLHRVQTSRLRRDGSRVDVEMTSSVLSDETGSPYGYLGVYVDVGHRMQLEDELRTAAHTDALTGLVNRAGFTAGLAVCGPDVDVLLLDLDGFKAVNDALGHAAGDAVLVEVGRRLRAVCRDDDVVARLGGDEFVVLLSAGHATASDAGAQALSRRVVDVLSEPYSVAGRTVTLGASVGLAKGTGASSVPGALEPGEALLRDADVAMYAAKAAGKGRVQVFEPALRDAVVERGELVQDLQAALGQDQLFLRWHPVADVRTGRMVGLEALVRWQHPQRGELLPGSFIGLAEETGLVVPLGEEVLHLACSAMRTWRERRPAGLPVVSVNLSPLQVRAGGLVETVRAALAEHDVPAGGLALELTEDVLLDDSAHVLAVLHELRDLGVRLAIDDFGTGYSSLSYLTRLPVDIVKLDRALLAAADEPASLALFDGVVALTRRLGLLTVAEGVETAAQWELLRGLEVPLAQGFLLTPPVRAESVPALLDWSWTGTTFAG